MSGQVAPQRERGNRRIGIGLAIFALAVFVTMIAKQWAAGH